MNVMPDPFPMDDALPSCGVCVSTGVKLLRFYLIRQSLTARGSRTSRGAGSILLCERCWRRATRDAALRRRPRRKVAA